MRRDDPAFSAAVTMREVSDCAGPRFTAGALPWKRRAVQHVPEAARLAYEGLPAVLVWALTRR